MKKIAFVLFLCLGILSCQEDKKMVSSLLNFVPPEATVVVKTNRFQEFSKALSENSFFSESELSAQKTLQKKMETLDFLTIKEKSLLCFSIIGRDVVFAFITKNSSGLVPDNVSKKNTMESFQYGGKEIKKFTLKGNTLYSVVLDDVFIGSGSKLIVENAVRMFNIHLPQQGSFRKLYNATSGDVSIFIQNEKFTSFYGHFFPKGNPSFLHNFSGWTALDVEVEENGLLLNGVLAEKPLSNSIFDYFKGLHPQKSQLAQVVPMNAIGFYAFTYQDFSLLQKNLGHNRKKTKLPPELKGLFASTNEIGVVYFMEGNAVVLNSKSVDKTEKALLSQQEIVDEFRGQPIFSFSETQVFYQAFFPLLKQKNLKFYTQLGHFFIFSEERSILENMIAHQQNGSVLASQAYFQNTAESLSDESSILLMGINKNLKTLLAQKTAETHQKEIENLSLHHYKLSALQFVHSNEFSHVNVSFQKATVENEENNVPQLMALKLENPLEGNPQFFENWRTGEQYIVAQDTKNSLYLFDHQGELHWKKQLDGRILGEIQSVDLFKNTRLQMAFLTPNKFYILGRDGKDVAPFPLEFKNPITRPLSVFDYAKNRNYRFVITQDKAITMLGNNAKKIDGFEFSQAKTAVLQAPKHLRIEKKDYIVIPEASGKLNILNRQGKSRITVEKNLDFSDNEWFLMNEKFTSTNAEGNLLQVDKNGRLSTKELELSENHKIAISANKLVSLSENMLNINGKELELDYGLYTPPKIFNIGDKTYVNVTDTQASKVYLFDEKGKLMPGFPVYGNSAIDLGNMDNEGKLEFVVKGEENSVLVYRVE